MTRSSCLVLFSRVVDIHLVLCNSLRLLIKATSLNIRTFLTITYIGYAYIACFYHKAMYVPVTLPFGALVISQTSPKFREQASI